MTDKFIGARFVYRNSDTGRGDKGKQGLSDNENSQQNKELSPHLNMSHQECFVIHMCVVCLHSLLNHAAQRSALSYSARAVLCETLLLSCYFDTPGHSVCITISFWYDFELFVWAWLIKEDMQLNYFSPIFCTWKDKRSKWSLCPHVNNSYLYYIWYFFAY